MEIKTTVIANDKGTDVKTSMTNKIDKWTDTQRSTLLYLRLSQGMDWGEIGKELKRKPSACKSMFAYAKLQHTIEELRKANDNWSQYGERAELELFNLRRENARLKVV